LTSDEIAAQLPRFEGLIFKTASLIEQQMAARRAAAPIELGFEDIRQRLRIKAWKALEGYDAGRSMGHPLERYVYSCIVNEKKDILKSPRRADPHIEDQVADGEEGHGNGKAKRSDAFELRYLSLAEDQAFVDAEVEPLRLPSTLTDVELQIVALLYEGWMQTEVRSQLSLSVRAIDAMMRSIREKMADWRPSPNERPAGPTPPLPRALRARSATVADRGHELLV
jgi:DNA-directed RNA polymerase specialized sigma24 family protein